MLFELVQQLGGLPEGVARGCQLLSLRVGVLLPACPAATTTGTTSLEPNQLRC